MWSIGYYTVEIVLIETESTFMSALTQYGTLLYTSMNWEDGFGTNSLKFYSVNHLVGMYELYIANAYS